MIRETLPEICGKAKLISFFPQGASCARFGLFSVVQNLCFHSVIMIIHLLAISYPFNSDTLSREVVCK